MGHRRFDVKLTSLRFESIYVVLSFLLPQRSDDERIPVVEALQKIIDPCPGGTGPILDRLDMDHDD
jgi:hypothetical protein